MQESARYPIDSGSAGPRRMPTVVDPAAQQWSSHVHWRAISYWHGVLLEKRWGAERTPSVSLAANRPLRSIIITPPVLSQTATRRLRVTVASQPVITASGTDKTSQPAKGGANWRGSHFFCLSPPNGVGSHHPHRCPRGRRTGSGGPTGRVTCRTRVSQHPILTAGPRIPLAPSPVADVPPLWEPGINRGEPHGRI